MSPAIPATRIVDRVLFAACDADHEAGRGDQAIVGAEHRCPKPRGPPAQMAFGENMIRKRARHEPSISWIRHRPIGENGTLVWKKKISSPTVGAQAGPTMMTL